MSENDPAEAGGPVSVHDPVNVGTALDLIGRQRKGEPPPMATCPRDGEPLISTFEQPGAEFHCVVCHGWFGFLAPVPAEATPELEARHAELQQRYEAERRARMEGTDGN